MAEGRGWIADEVPVTALVCHGQYTLGVSRCIVWKNTDQDYISNRISFLVLDPAGAAGAVCRAGGLSNLLAVRTGPQVPPSSPLEAETSWNGAALTRE